MTTPTFLTYAQNLEDVLLWRALGHVKDGFYIDVGANDPVEHSVTKAFYDAGWHGINIEPLPAFHQAFLDQRPRDINLAIAAGSTDGTLTLYDVADVNGWASPERGVAESHRAAGHDVRELTVPVRTLASVCAEHASGDIHFLKVDVEGFEGEVLRGMDFKRWRPWVLVVEATLPGSRETAHETWEHLVTGHAYRYAWFDGLNRYYVAEEHAELLAHFGVQPNVFDGYLSHHLDKAWKATRETEAALRETEQAADRRARELDAEAQALRAELDAQAQLLRAEIHDAQQHAVALENELIATQAEAARLHAELLQAHANGQQAIDWARGLEARLVATLNSTSWKVTRPLRYVGGIAADLRRPGLAKRALTRVTANQRLRRVLIPILVRHPALGRRVSATLQAIKQTPLAPPLPAELSVPEEHRGLPASVRTVLTDLQRTRQHLSK